MSAAICSICDGGLYPEAGRVLSSFSGATIRSPALATHPLAAASGHTATKAGETTSRAGAAGRWSANTLARLGITPARCQVAFQGEPMVTTIAGEQLDDTDLLDMLREFTNDAQTYSRRGYVGTCDPRYGDAHAAINDCLEALGW